MFNRWLLTALLFSSMLQTDVNMKQKSKITVGSGLGCHYPPELLNQAIKEHNTIYLTTGVVYPAMHINNPQLKIIGGLKNCYDWNKHGSNSQKSLISGFHKQRPITINSQQKFTDGPNTVHLKKLRLSNGYAKHGGGLAITGPARVQLDDIEIEHNVAKKQGGGISLDGSGIELQLNNSHIQYNQAGQLGGGISCHGDHLINAQNEQQIEQNSATIANNLLIDQHCFIKFNQTE